ncbi:hypothetical protein ACLB2K_059900 [Fragaria x ananassa]
MLLLNSISTRVSPSIGESMQGHGLIFSVMPTKCILICLITRLKDSGLLQHISWDDADHQWVDMWSAPKYPCDWYGHCGANSKCSPDNINMFGCECIPGYEPKSVDGWNRRDGTDGCVCRNGEGFVKVARVKDPDTSNVAMLRTSMGIKLRV